MEAKNLPEAVLTLIKEAESPIDAFYTMVDKVYKYRDREPIYCRALSKIAADLLGKDFILDAYIRHAELEDMQKAQYCWHKEASQKLTRDELFEFILVEDLPEFIKKASVDVARVLNNIQEILKEASIGELASKANAELAAKLGPQTPAMEANLAAEILKKQRNAPNVLSKKAMMSKANKGMSPSNLASPKPSTAGMMRPASGFKMNSMGTMGMRKF